MMSRPMTVAVVTVMVVSFVVVGVVGVVAGTGGGGARGSDPVGSLEEVRGRWVPVDDTGAPAPVIATMSLTFADGLVLVETGCNNGRSAAVVLDSRLVIDALATTRKACPPPLGPQEAWVLDMASDSPQMELFGPTLSLRWGVGGEFRLLLRQSEDTPAV